MGTRAEVIFADNRDIVLILYVQSDGAPEGLGQDLYDLLAGREIVDLPGDGNLDVADYGNTSNGIGDLAAFVASELKRPFPATRVHAVAAAGCMADDRGLADLAEPMVGWYYVIREEFGAPVISVHGEAGKHLFSGTLEEFADEYGLSRDNRMSDRADVLRDEALFLNAFARKGPGFWTRKVTE